MDQPGFIPQTNENVVEITPRTWNALADAANGNRIGQTSSRASIFPGWPPVMVSNKTGSAINAPYRAFSIGEPIWTIGDNKLPDCCFRLEAYDVNKPIAIIQQPLAVDEPGLAVVVGPTLVEVTGAGSTSDRKGSPNSSGIIVPGTGDKVQFSNQRPTGGGRVLALLGVGGSSPVRIFMTPSGGIAAGGSATCTEYAEDLTTSIGTTATVWNHRSSVVAGSVLVLVMSGATKLWVVEGNCPIVITEPSEVP
jgi:hypothetical protein